MNEFPIRCHWDYHDAPAVVMLRLAFKCGCPEGETETCADCANAMPVGYAAKGRNQACLRCNTWPAPYVVIGTRPLNEGDLPDPETVAAARSATKEPLERGDGA